MRRLLVVSLMSLLSAGVANAEMDSFITYTAEGAGLSIDAVGLADYTDGIVQAEIPIGAQIYRAYLYSAEVGYSGSGLHDVVLDGTTLTSNASSRLDVGSKDGNSWVSENRWDVTGAVSARVGGGSGLFDFSVRELGYLDGEVLAVLYGVPTQELKTAMIFDGELSTTGDSFTVSLTPPYDGTSDAIMSLGISYGYQPTGQYSTVDINGQRLTSSAGGQDDGYGANGGLITAGGIGDSTANPLDPYANASDPRYDDELYNLASFLRAGDNLITISTLNPSNDDNVFFMGLVTKGEANPVVPAPGAILLGSIGMGLVHWMRRRRMV